MGFSECVLVASLFVTAVLVVPAVLVPSSDVNVIDEVALSESECEIVELQTFSLHKARSVSCRISKRHECRRKTRENTSSVQKLDSRNGMRRRTLVVSRSTRQPRRELNITWTGVKGWKWTLRNWTITCLGQKS